MKTLLFAVLLVAMLFLFLASITYGWTIPQAG